MLVELAAVGVSFVDGLIVRGAYQVRPQLPFTPGSCVVGRVVAVGEGVESPCIGTVVATVLTGFGGYASHATVPAEVVVPVPAGVTADIAAAAMDLGRHPEVAGQHRVAAQPLDRRRRLGRLVAGGGRGAR
ncbi:alcohol dehydrogenase catalytic domain-containing protein [Saccharopolyspora terrae]|uniref:alcohol dehydrogenase catalytic domain-containing protein n=1 Tax=Saccharopolyspora terrae TaxID=2530384 RepID=UPI001A9CCFB5|nr:alcohol dehydrogenase catalytic domain-containing protein [Saccharopolyspora terrae]